MKEHLFYNKYKDQFIIVYSTRQFGFDAGDSELFVYLGEL